MTLAPTRRLPRIAKRPPGWTQHPAGLWSWTSPTGTVTISIYVDEDTGSVSAPCVSGVGRVALVLDELEEAIDAQRALLTYLAQRAHARAG